MNSELRRTVHAWIDDEVDQADADELRGLLAEAGWVDPGAEDELAHRFAGPLTFGTAGLRGPLRAGPNGMNRAVVRRAAAGLVAWLRSSGTEGATVVIGYDGRTGSRIFACDSAGVFAAAGFDARLLPEPLPTPVLAFAVRHLSAALGVMVTASHNPADDNGYKVFARDGGQIAPPVDAQIEAAIRGVGPTRSIPLEPDYTVLGDEIVQAYVDAVTAPFGHHPQGVKIVHTALHGVGTQTLRRVFAAAGFDEPISVRDQAQPDAAFPTVEFPNPEEPGVLELAIELAQRENADLVIANDPDADRCAVAVPVPGAGWRMLRGDELGVLLADALMPNRPPGTYATTIVSSSMLARMCATRGLPYAETLTGFKYVSRAADDLIYGYEEALGYCIAPEVVRDKDGISAALLVATFAAFLAAVDATLLDQLETLYAEYGRCATDQISVRAHRPEEITAMMTRLRADPPMTLLDKAVVAEDLLPRTDAVRLTWNGGRVVVRPSGTEPKLKAYLEVLTKTAAEAEHQLASLRIEISAALGGRHSVVGRSS